MTKNIALVFLALLLTYASPCLATNTAYGTAAGSDLSTGTNNTIMGTEAGVAITTGTDNTLLGYESGYGVTGSENIILGEDPSSAITTGSSNILIGNSLTEVTNTSSSQLDIGDTLYGSLGGSGTITAANNFTVLGTIIGNLFSGSGASLTSLNGSNISSGTVAAARLPTGTVITSTASPAQGDILYYNGSNWVDLGYGISGYFLETQGASANPEWAAAGSGTVDSGTQYQMGYYASTGTSISGDSSIVTDSSGDLSLGSGSYQLDSDTVLTFPDADTTSIAVGKSALTSQSSTSLNNTAVGDTALDSMTTGTDSTAVGSAALYSTTGSPNTALGYKAGYAVTTGTDNTLVGYKSGFGVTGSHNIILGEDPSSAITSGSSNILIGNSLTEVSDSSSTQLDIGDSIYGDLEATSGGTALTVGTSSDTGVTLTIAGEGSMIVPSGSTAERPSSTTDGQIRYNSSLSALEAYVDGAWATITTGSASSGQMQHALLTSGTSWTSPSGITSSTNFKVTVVGGGGAGGPANGGFGGSGGGGGGGATAIWYTSGLSPSTAYTYAIGAGGTSSGSGGNSSFTVGMTTVTADGGSAGATGDSDGAGGGAGGTASGGTINISGQGGSGGSVGGGGGTTGGGGSGGSSTMGGGGNGGGNGIGAAGAGGDYGGGGGGGEEGTSVSAAGADGCILIEWVQ